MPIQEDQLAPARPRRGHFLATVLSNDPLCREHNRLILLAPGFPESRPGQFVQVRCRDADGAPLGDVPEREWGWSEPQGGFLSTSGQPDLFGPTPIIRRPFSIAGRHRTPEGHAIELINRDVGPGTHWLFNLRAGQHVDLIGPLGNTFTMPALGEIALLVGGGVGIPPMIYIAQALAELAAQTGGPIRRAAIAFCGATSRDLLPLQILPGVAAQADPSEPALRTGEFARHGFDSIISTDDGTCGFHGRITEPLVLFLDRYIGGGAFRPVIYTCGPEPMMKAVAHIARERKLGCEVAVERAMACGMGTCQSCVIREVAENERGWRYRLACTDGPVFDAASLLW